MTDYAFQVQYRQEYIAEFEQNFSIMRQGTMQETVIKGNQAIFLVSGSGNQSAVTRGVNGLIPYTTASNTQKTATLVEYHAAIERTSFNIFASQGDQKKIMMDASIAMINRNIDSTIITTLDGATNDTGSAVKASIDLIVKARTGLAINDVDLTQEDSIFAAITPAFEGYLYQTTEFASADYVEIKPFAGPAKRMRRWMGVNWMCHNHLTGVGTASEKCYMWHKNALGHAANTKEMDTEVGYEGKQQLSWCRSSIYHGAVILQNSGIVQMVHDGSAYTVS
jgi:hypothetical protein